MITKALAVLQEYRDAMKRRKMSEYYIRIDEAILELEELNNRSCDGCVYEDKNELMDYSCLECSRYYTDKFNKWLS